MTIRPGSNVVLITTPSTVSLPTDSGTGFAVGLTDRGPLLATLVQSLSDFVTVFGTRQTYSPLYDAVEVFFREGGNRLYIGRVVGPSATQGFRNLVDGGAATSLVVTANGPGSWSANYKVAVVSGVGAGTYKIQITDASNVVLEDSGDLIDQNAAAAWSQSGSQYVRITVGGSANNPVNVAATALSAGTDDRGNVTDAQWLAALNLFSVDLGPGQVFAPNRTTSAGQQQLVDHAEANGRVALCDLTDSGTTGTLQTAAAAISKSKFGAAFAPWIVYPGVAVGTFRTLSPSSLIAGLIARNDPTLGPNRPSAGAAGVSRYAIGLSQNAFSATNRGALNTSGVNVIRSMIGGIRVYGWRSKSDPNTDQGWLDFGNGRLYMAMAAELNAAGETFMFDEIDGQNGETIGNFHSALVGVCLTHYNRHELFGDTPDEAFSVDTGPAVNTLVRIQNNELHAVVSVKMAPMAEYVEIDVVKRQVSEVI